MGEIGRDAARYRYLLANAIRMSEPLFNAKNGSPVRRHQVSLVIDLPGDAPWATEETFGTALDEAMRDQ